MGSLQAQYIALGVVIALSIVTLAFLASPFGAQNYRMSGTLAVETEPLEPLRTAALAQFDLAKRNSSLLRPWNSTQAGLVRPALEQAPDYATLFAAQALTPGQVEGFSTITRIEEPAETLPLMLGFAHDYSSVGWISCSGTFPSPRPSCFSIYIMRLDMASSAVRDTLERGETTLYFVSCGFTVAGRGTVRNSFTVQPASYLFDGTNGAFSFLSEDGNVQMSSPAHDRLSFDIIFGTHRLVVALSQLRVPQTNQRAACAPCADGLGSSYWSYTRGICSAELHWEQGDITSLFGSAWVDRQVLRQQRPNTAIGSLGLNMRNFFGRGNYGFGRYVRSFMQFNDGTDYLVWSKDVPRSDRWALTLSSVFEARYNIYQDDGSVERNLQTVIRVLAFDDAVWRGEAVRMPTAITMRIKMPGGAIGDVLLNGRMMRDAWILDYTGMPRRSAGAMVLQGTHLPDDLMAPMGMGYIEAGGFASAEGITEAMLENARIDMNKEPDFINGQNALTGAQQAGMVVVMLILWMALFYIIIQVALAIAFSVDPSIIGSRAALAGQYRQAAAAASADA